VTKLPLITLLAESLAYQKMSDVVFGSMLLCMQSISPI